MNSMSTEQYLLLQNLKNHLTRCSIIAHNLMFSDPLTEEQRKLIRELNTSVIGMQAGQDRFEKFEEIIKKERSSHD